MKFDDPDQLFEYLDTEGIRYHKVGVFDVDGVFRGKYMNRDKFESAVRKGFGFCDVVLGWDSHDQLFDNTKVSGWHTGYRDAPVNLDLSTVRRLPMEEDTILVIGDFGGDYEGVCPRRLLGRLVDKAQAMGFGVRAALEYEFFMFKETPESARAKGYRDLEPLTPGMFGYSMLRSGVHAELYHDLLDTMAELDCPIEGLHTETGPGVLEAALFHDEARSAADKAALFKTFTKIVAQRLGLMATFMAKWSNLYPGQSGHIHVSLEDAESGKNLFHDDADPEGMSKLMRHFIAGQVALMPQLLAMVCATVNAYRRLVPGMWAPTHANWGIENRTTALRAIPNLLVFRPADAIETAESWAVALKQNGRPSALALSRQNLSPVRFDAEMKTAKGGYRLKAADAARQVVVSLPRWSTAELRETCCPRRGGF